MTHALLVADQHVDRDFLASVSSKPRARSEEMDLAGQTMPAYCAFPRDESRLVRTGFGGALDRAATVHDHLSRSWRAVAGPVQSLQRAQSNERFHQEMKWLTENGHKFSGRWVALEGERLLAFGSTSREVFSKVADLPQPPLVIRIDEDELPFAGW